MVLANEHIRRDLSNSKLNYSSGSSLKANTLKSRGLKERRSKEPSCGISYVGKNTECIFKVAEKKKAAG